MFTFRTTDGEFRFKDRFEGNGYSGTGEGRNNPTLEWKPNVGPIPRGLYRIGDPITDAHMGPLAFPLVPIDHSACGRTGFYIHGNNAANDASHGCIILGWAIRAHIIAVNLYTEENRLLRVV